MDLAKHFLRAAQRLRWGGERYAGRHVLSRHSTSSPIDNSPQGRTRSEEPSDTPSPGQQRSPQSPTTIDFGHLFDRRHLIHPAYLDWQRRHDLDRLHAELAARVREWQNRVASRPAEFAEAA